MRTTRVTVLLRHLITVALEHETSHALPVLLTFPLAQLETHIHARAHAHTYTHNTHTRKHTYIYIQSARRQTESRIVVVYVKNIARLQLSEYAVDSKLVSQIANIELPINQSEQHRVHIF